MEIPRPIHPFPARMAASIPWSILERLPGRRCHSVLDPMAGSGTTLVLARRLGHKAIGVDTDPLAVLIASAWCSDVDEAKLMESATYVAEQSAGKWTTIPQGHAYPSGSDAETREFLRYWFDSKSRRQLTALTRAISDVKLPVIRKLLWCALSRLIVVKQSGASLAMDVSHSRPHRAYERAPIQPIRAFLRAIRRIVDASPFKSSNTKAPPRASISLGDARRLHIDDQTIDVVITSPPYLNAIDYMRGHKLSLVWMEHSIPELRGIRSSNIGAEAKPTNAHHIDAVIRKAFSSGLRKGILDNRQSDMFTRYLADMRTVLGEIRRVLKRTGQATLVVGNSTIRGTFVENSESIKCLAHQVGLRLLSERTRSLPDNRRYLPPPRATDAGKELAKRMREEVLLQFAR